jgi:hypothetical protein
MTIVKTTRTTYTLNCPVCGFDSDPIEDVSKVDGWVIKGKECFHEECAPRCKIDGCEAFTKSLNYSYCGNNHENKAAFYHEDAVTVLKLNKCIIKDCKDEYTGADFYIGRYRGEETYRFLEDAYDVISFINGALK